MMLGKTLLDWTIWLVLGTLDTFFKTMAAIVAVALAAAVALGTYLAGVWAARKIEERRHRPKLRRAA